MKYLQTHPIHEDFSAMDNPHRKHADSELKKTHANAENYAGAGEQPKNPVKGEHHLSDITMTKGDGGKSTIAGQNGGISDEEQKLASKEAEHKAGAKSIAGQNGSAATDDEQRLSDIAESRIIRFSNFNN